MEKERTRRSLLGASAIILGICCVVFFVGLTALFMTAEVGGTAKLPNGTVANINGSFSCSANSDTTEIEAGGHVFAFSPTTISIDGIPVGPLDSTVKDVQIDVSTWSASLRVNGSEVTTRR